MANPASFGLERKNPLPKGRYWVFRIGKKDIEAFDLWLAKHRRAGSLRVEASDFDPGGPFLDLHPPTAFVLWEVLRDGEVVWEGPGLPDKATPNVTSRDDVESGPVILEPAERLDAAAKEAVKSVTRGAESFTVILFVVGVLYLLSKKD